MEHTKIEINNKFIKKLNDLNQDVKYLFDIYYIFPNGIIASHKKHYKLIKGMHYGKTEYKLFDDCLDIIKLNSNNIYTAIKEHKKHLKFIEVRDDEIFLIGEEDYRIGNIIKTNSINIKDILFDIAGYDQTIENFTSVIELSSDDVESMVKNEYRNIKYKDYRTRITKEIIPGLKKSHSISINMYSDKDDNNLFGLCIKNIRGSMTSFHMYKCIIL